MFDPGQVNFCLVSHLWFGSGFAKFPLIITNFTIFFPSGQRWVGLLFTEGQKYARVRSGTISTQSVPSKLDFEKIFSGQK